MKCNLISFAPDPKGKHSKSTQTQNSVWFLSFSQRLSEVPLLLRRNVLSSPVKVKEVCSFETSGSDYPGHSVMSQKNWILKTTFIYNRILRFHENSATDRSKLTTSSKQWTRNDSDGDGQFTRNVHPTHKLYWSVPARRTVTYKFQKAVWNTFQFRDI